MSTRTRTDQGLHQSALCEHVSSVSVRLGSAGAVGTADCPSPGFPDVTYHAAFPGCPVVLAPGLVLDLQLCPFYISSFDKLAEKWSFS